jgi:CDP-6-deoxy-D-xylo-4-hexulose-3-dehydrase
LLKKSVLTMTQSISPPNTTTEAELRAQVFQTVQEYYKHKFQSRAFVAGQTYIPASGKVFDRQELVKLVDYSLDFWLTTGRYAAEFEERFAQWMGVKLRNCLGSAREFGRSLKGQRL